MIEAGNTIVVKHGNGALSFYWLCTSVLNDYVFFSWFGNPLRPSPSDYWRVSKSWFNDQLANGDIEVYPHLPLDQYGDEFEKQATERTD